jgi:hypothetical protein
MKAAEWQLRQWFTNNLAPFCNAAKSLVLLGALSHAMVSPPMAAHRHHAEQPEPRHEKVVFFHGECAP